jgi:pimeloyl-ACP methyl ester carboxylesterase
MLLQSDIPKLLLYQFPGMAMSFSLVAWCRETIPNLTAIEVGEGLHYPQEENPELYVEALLEWLDDL